MCVNRFLAFNDLLVWGSLSLTPKITCCCILPPFQLNALKATAVECLENLMEEVAEGGKELVRKLSEDEKLIKTLEIMTEDFNFHIYTHTRARSWRDFFSDSFRRSTRVTSALTPQYAIPREGPTRGSTAAMEIPAMECPDRVGQSRFRAYNSARKLKQQREESGPGNEITRLIFFGWYYI